MKKSKPLPSPKKVPTGFSYSVWGMFNKCMLMYYGVRMLGYQEKPGPAVERGIHLHKVQEEYLKGEIKILPPTFNAFAKHYRQLKKLNPIVEQFWGTDEKWKQTKWNSWVVIKMDAALPPVKGHPFAWMQDLKSGKEYPTHVDQGSLYSCVTLAIYPKAEGVDVEFWYADQGYPITHTFDRDVILQERKKWVERGREVLSPRKKWPASPSLDNCKWCPVRSDKGGICHEWKKA